MVNTLSNHEISRLITCPKKFKTVPPKFPDITTQNITFRFKVYGLENDDEFSVFFAQSAKMQSDFSLGLRYDNFLLYRCNGYHGTTKNNFYSAPHHAYPHAHILSEADIANGRALKPSSCENLTGEYIDFPDAVQYFCNKCGIISYRKHFSHLFQGTIW